MFPLFWAEFLNLNYYQLVVLLLTPIVICGLHWSTYQGINKGKRAVPVGACCILCLFIDHTVTLFRFLERAHLTSAWPCLWLVNKKLFSTSFCQHWTFHQKRLRFHTEGGNEGSIIFTASKLRRLGSLSNLTRATSKLVALTAQHKILGLLSLDSEVI